MKFCLQIRVEHGDHLCRPGCAAVHAVRDGLSVDERRDEARKVGVTGAHGVDHVLDGNDVAAVEVVPVDGTAQQGGDDCVVRWLHLLIYVIAPCLLDALSIVAHCVQHSVGLHVGRQKGLVHRVQAEVACEYLAIR